MTALFVKQVYDLIVKRGKVVFNNRPDHVDIDMKVIMNKDITHPDNLKPWYIWMLFLKFIRYSRCCFTEDLNMM